MLGSSFLLIFWHLVRGAVLGILNLRHDSPHLVLRGCNFMLAFWKLRWKRENGVLVKKEESRWPSAFFIKIPNKTRKIILCTMFLVTLDACVPIWPWPNFPHFQSLETLISYHVQVSTVFNPREFPPSFHVP
jgi:hypothetical protein